MKIKWIIGMGITLFFVIILNLGFHGDEYGRMGFERFFNHQIFNSQFVLWGLIIGVFILFLFLILKFVKIWWIKSILLGAVIGAVIFPLPLFFLSVWWLCLILSNCGPGGEGAIGLIFPTILFSPLIGALIGWLIGKWNQRRLQLTFLNEKS